MVEKKRADEMTDEEALKALSPKRVVREVQKEAQKAVKSPPDMEPRKPWKE
jgi:hypothetical protein